MLSKLLVGFLFFCCLSCSIVAIEVHTDVEFVSGNETYKVNHTMNFSEIEVNSTWIEFNDTRFYIDSINDINITLVFLHDDILNATNGAKVLEFYGNTIVGNVWFNISGFTDGSKYVVHRNNILYTNITADSTQNISFNNSDWSQRLFTIYSAEQCISSFTFVIEGINIRCTSTSTGSIDGYSWEIEVNGITEGATGWINDTSGVSHIFTCPDGGFSRITHCVHSGGVADCVTKGIGEIPINNDKYPAENYRTCKSCEDAGYYWYEDVGAENETCHEDPKPLPWNDTGKDGYEEAGKHNEGKIKIGEWNVDAGWVMIPVVLALFFIIFRKKKKGKK